MPSVQIAQGVPVNIYGFTPNWRRPSSPPLLSRRSEVRLRQPREVPSSSFTASHDAHGTLPGCSWSGSFVVQPSRALLPPHQAAPNPQQQGIAVTGTFPMTSSFASPGVNPVLSSPAPLLPKPRTRNTDPFAGLPPSVRLLHSAETLEEGQRICQNKGRHGCGVTFGSGPVDPRTHCQNPRCDSWRSVLPLRCYLSSCLTDIHRIMKHTHCGRCGKVFCERCYKPNSPRSSRRTQGVSRHDFGGS